MDNNLLFNRIEDLVNNPTPRVPICLCLDTSGSMDTVEGGDYQSTGRTIIKDGQSYVVVTGGMTRLSELQKGIEEFYNAIRDDEIAQFSAEICIVTFDDRAECLVDFANIDRQEVPVLKTGNRTSMGEGVNLALDLLEERKNEYKNKGVDYFQPWLVLMTDGQPNGSSSELTRAAERTVQMVNSKKLTVFPIAIGNESDISALARFSPKRPPLKLQGLKFKEFFEWLGKSVSRTSQSTPGETIKLDMEGLQGWAEL